MIRYNTTTSNMTHSGIHMQALLRALMITSLVMIILMAPDFAHAQSGGGASAINFPIVDEIICGFIGYAKGKLAPLIAAAVIIFAILGQWLGMGKMWGTLMYVGIGLGVILGILTFIGRYSSLPASCV